MQLWTGALSWWKCRWPDLKSDGISSRTPLKPQHSNPKLLANQLWCIDFLTSSTPLIIPHRLPAFLESLMPLKNWYSIHARCSKNSLKHSIRFWCIFPSLKQNFFTYHSSSRPDCIFEIHALWQSGFSRVYSNCCCSCSFQLEIIKIGQSSHKIYSNNILNFQESTPNLNACTKKSGNLLNTPRRSKVFLIHWKFSREFRYNFDWLFDWHISTVSTCLGLFYASRFGNCVHCTFIFTFLCRCLLKDFIRSYVISSIPI